MEIPVYIMLGLTSVVGLAFIVERGLALRWAKVVPPDITGALTACKSRDDVKACRRVCKQKPSPPGRPLLRPARHEIVRLERGLVVLEIIVGIAPLLGLVGTIAGMMTLYGDIGLTGLNDAARRAQGTGGVLNATLMGLLIAIPSLIAWSY